MRLIETVQDHWIWFLILVPVLPYVLMPCAIKALQRFRRNFTLDAFDPAQQPPPSEVAMFIRQSAEQLQPKGFRVVAHFLIPDLLSNVTAIIAVLENRERDDAAIAAVMYGFQDESRKQVLMQEKYVEFSTEFVDDTEVSTNNSQQESAFRPVARRRIRQFPGTKDAGILYSAHQRTLERLTKPAKRPLPAPGQWSEELRRSMTREFTEQLETGYLQLDSTGEYFLATWKGAYLMTWKQMWPFSRLRLRRRRVNARRWLEEFGLA